MKNNINNKHPLVSVIMPVYNAGDFLVEAIESILNQTYKNWELIAVNDGSTDNSWNLLKKISSKDKRIKIFNLKKNYGLGYAANFAIKKSKGQFLARFDADDIMSKKRLELQVDYFKNHPEILAVGGQCILIDEKNKKIGEKKFPLNDDQIRKMAFYMMSLQAGSMMINKSKLPKDFKYYSTTHHYFEDHELLFKLLKYGKVANLPKNLLYYRQHNNNSTKKINVKKIFFSIFKLRIKAIFDGILPDLKGIILNIIQLILILFLPVKTIEKLYFFFRIKSKKSSIIKKESKIKLHNYYEYKLLPKFWFENT